MQAVKTVSTIEREQLEVDFAKKVLWEMIDKGLMLTLALPPSPRNNLPHVKGIRS